MRDAVLGYRIVAAWRDRIGSRRMGGENLLARRCDAHFADREPFSELDEQSFADQVARRWFRQKIDVEIGRHRKLDPANLGEDRDVKRDVRQRENRRPGNRAAGPKLAWMIDHAQPRPHRPDLFDRKDAADLHLREFRFEEGRDFVAVEGERWALRIRYMH